MNSGSGKFATRLWQAVVRAFRPALSTGLWIVKMTAPITLGVAVLDYLGVVAWFSRLAAPLFSLMGLTGDAALAWLSAALGNLYSGLAVMAAIGVDYRSALILAVMGLICHNLILETAVQKKAWASPVFIVVLRIGVSLLAGVLLNLVLPEGMTGRLRLPEGMEQIGSWGDLFKNWLMTLLPVVFKMVVIVTTLNILQSILREFGILKIIAWPLRPLMKVFGLPQSTSFLWIICNVIGITYGGAAILDEVQRGQATREDARLLNTHVGISHSILEDTLLFMSVGLPVFWLLIPRLLLAIGAVWIQRLVRALRKKQA